MNENVFAENDDITKKSPHDHITVNRNWEEVEKLECTYSWG